MSKYKREKKEQLKWTRPCNCVPYPDMPEQETIDEYRGYDPREAKALEDLYAAVLVDVKLYPKGSLLDRALKILSKGRKGRGE